MKTENEHLKNLFRELQEANDHKDSLKIILVLSIYAEYLVNELVKLKWGTELNRLNMYWKLKILKSEEIITESEFKVLDSLRDVRNDYAHNLVINREKIIKIMLKTPINWTMEKERAKRVEEEMKSKPLYRFQYACGAKLMFLFSKLAEYKGQNDFKKIPFKTRMRCADIKI